MLLQILPEYGQNDAGASGGLSCGGLFSIL